jgi:hypothetical protein
VFSLHKFIAFGGFYTLIIYIYLLTGISFKKGANWGLTIKIYKLIWDFANKKPLPKRWGFFTIY